MQWFQTAALVAIVSLCAGATKADLVQFDIQTSTFAPQLSLNAGAGASVGYYEQWVCSRTSGEVDGSCATLNHDGMAYYGWGSLDHQRTVAVEPSTSLDPLLVVPLMFWLRRQRS